MRWPWSRREPEAPERLWCGCSAQHLDSLPIPISLMRHESYMLNHVLTGTPVRRFVCHVRHVFSDVTYEEIDRGNV